MQSEEREKIEKSIEIDAPKERIWEVLLKDHYFRQWSCAFAPGSYADTDWCLNSTAEFKGPSEDGLFGKIILSRPHEAITIKYEGVIYNGVKDSEGQEAKKWAGCLETYHISETGNNTCLLSISQDTPKRYAHALFSNWDEAMERIKNLAEGTRDYIEEASQTSF
ncbi:MAG: ATPase [Halobacteriovoraceae bacterium]|nr:ATPase [Halobacteriovoraceae bacterium]|tara:strand:+ start:73671 stop:74165 length:495 start_codon:yes stop_codon:yes gene_type:complete